MKIPHPIDRDIIEKILDSCGEQLKVKLLQNLGCGDYGCAFLTDSYTTIKITKHKKEADAASFLLEKNLKHPALPKIFDVMIWEECHEWDDPIYVIHRENLKNMNISPHWFEEVIGGLEADLQGAYAEGTLSSDDIFNKLLELFEEHPSDPKTELIAEKLAELYAFLHPQGMWIDDVIIQNFGMRDGQPVLRDLGALIIAEPLKRF